MEKQNLTVANVLALPLPEKGRLEVMDSRQPGLMVRISPAGHRFWYLYKKINGRVRKRSLGYVTGSPKPPGDKLKALSTVRARRNCGKLISDIAEGKDTKQKSAGQKTLQQLIDEYIEFRKLGERGLKPRTVKDYQEAAQETFKRWLNLPAHTITPEMAKQRYRRKGKSARASNGMRVLRAVYRYAMAEYPDKFKVDPTVAVEWRKLKPKQRYLKQHQLPLWWSAVCDLESNRAHSGAPEASVLLRLYLLTGMRKTEALRLRWDDVDLRDSSFTLRDTKNGEDVELPLSDYARTMLSDLRRNYPVVSPFVFPNRRKPTQPLNNIQFWVKKVNDDSGVAFSLHDLRRTFVTYGGMEVPEIAIKKLVNHRNAADVTMTHYAQVPLEGLRRHAQVITDFFLSKVGENVSGRDIKNA